MSQVRIVGSGRPNPWLPGSVAQDWRVDVEPKVVSYSPDDCIVTVNSTLPVAELQCVLAEKGQTLPLGWQARTAETVGGLLGMGMYHGREASHGPVRDWVLGLTCLRYDGSVARCGARVVKSVAGFDIHKFFVGSRGGLGPILEVHLRVVPLRRLGPDAMRLSDGREVTALMRVLRQDLASFRSRPEVAGVDEATSTLALATRFEVPAGGWSIGHGGVRSPGPHPLEARAKAVLDPKGQYAEGWA